MGMIASSKNLLVTSSLASAGRIPAAALAAGMTSQTFGRSPIVYAATGDSVPNQNLAQFTFFGYNSANPTPPVQQSDGSILLRGHDTANAGAATAWINGAKQNNWGGTAFGGGALVRFIAKWTPVTGAITGVPALWWLDIEHLSGVVAWTYWSGQTNVQHWPEQDCMEYNRGTLTSHGNAWHDWWNDGTTHNVSSLFGAVTGNAPYSQYNTFDCLWIPATPLRPGFLGWYMNDALTKSYTYQQFINNSGFGPPPVSGSTAMSVADSRHIVPIIGNGNSDGRVSDFTVISIQVWQKSSSMNLVQ